jgi:hypothetical protein
MLAHRISTSCRDDPGRGARDHARARREPRTAPDVVGILRILTNFDMDSRIVLSLITAEQSPLRALLACDDQEAMARRIAHCAQLRLLPREELARYVAHRCTIAGAARVPFNERTLDALFEIGRGTCARPTTSRSIRSTTPPPATPPSPSSTSSLPVRIAAEACFDDVFGDEPRGEDMGDPSVSGPAFDRATGGRCISCASAAWGVRIGPRRSRR